MLLLDSEKGFCRISMRSGVKPVTARGIKTPQIPKKFTFVLHDPHGLCYMRKCNCLLFSLHDNALFTRNKCPLVAALQTTLLGFGVSTADLDAFKFFTGRHHEISILVLCLFFCLETVRRTATYLLRFIIVSLQSH